MFGKFTNNHIESVLDNLLSFLKDENREKYISTVTKEYKRILQYVEYAKNNLNKNYSEGFKAGVLATELGSLRKKRKMGTLTEVEAKVLEESEGVILENLDELLSKENDLDFSMGLFMGALSVCMNDLLKSYSEKCMEFDESKLIEDFLNSDVIQQGKELIDKAVSILQEANFNQVFSDILGKKDNVEKDKKEENKVQDKVGDKITKVEPIVIYRNFPEATPLNHIQVMPDGQRQYLVHIIVDVAKYKDHILFMSVKEVKSGKLKKKDTLVMYTKNMDIRPEFLEKSVGNSMELFYYADENTRRNYVFWKSVKLMRVFSDKTNDGEVENKKENNVNNGAKKVKYEFYGRVIRQNPGYILMEVIASQNPLLHSEDRIAVCNSSIPVKCTPGDYFKVVCKGILETNVKEAKWFSHSEDLIILESIKDPFDDKKEKKEKVENPINDFLKEKFFKEENVRKLNDVIQKWTDNFAKAVVDSAERKASGVASKEITFYGKVLDKKNEYVSLRIVETNSPILRVGEEVVVYLNYTPIECSSYMYLKVKCKDIMCSSLNRNNHWISSIDVISVDYSDKIFDEDGKTRVLEFEGKIVYVFPDCMHVKVTKSKCAELKKDESVFIYGWGNKLYNTVIIPGGLDIMKGNFGSLGKSVRVKAAQLSTSKRGLLNAIYSKDLILLEMLEKETSNSKKIEIPVESPSDKDNILNKPKGDKISIEIDKNNKSSRKEPYVLKKGERCLVGFVTDVKEECIVIKVENSCNTNILPGNTCIVYYQDSMKLTEKLWNERVSVVFTGFPALLEQIVIPATTVRHIEVLRWSEPRYLIGRIMGMERKSGYRMYLEVIDPLESPYKKSGDVITLNYQVVFGESVLDGFNKDDIVKVKYRSKETPLHSDFMVPLDSWSSLESVELVEPKVKDEVTSLENDKEDKASIAPYETIDVCYINDYWLDKKMKGIRDPKDANHFKALIVKEYKDGLVVQVIDPRDSVSIKKDQTIFIQFKEGIDATGHCLLDRQVIIDYNGKSSIGGIKGETELQITSEDWYSIVSATMENQGLYGYISEDKYTEKEENSNDELKNGDSGEISSSVPYEQTSLCYINDYWRRKGMRDLRPYGLSVHILGRIIEVVRSGVVLKVINDRNCSSIHNGNTLYIPFDEDADARHHNLFDKFVVLDFCGHASLANTPKGRPETDLEIQVDDWFSFVAATKKIQQAYGYIPKDEKGTCQRDDLISRKLIYEHIYSLYRLAESTPGLIVTEDMILTALDNTISYGEKGDKEGTSVFHLKD